MLDSMPSSNKIVWRCSVNLFESIDHNFIGTVLFIYELVYDIYEAKLNGV